MHPEYQVSEWFNIGEPAVTVLYLILPAYNGYVLLLYAYVFGSAGCV